MSAYAPPLRDLRFVLLELLDVPTQEFDAETIDQVLEAAGTFARDVIAPLNGVGDQQGCRMPSPGVVSTPDGFQAAYRLFTEGGWSGLACSPAHGGQGCPGTVNNAVYEMLSGANMGWSAYPGMSHAAYTCLAANGNDAQKALYLPKITSGEWAGTMCLTEPHAGTDLGLLRTRATPQPDGTYRISGTKIFISGGEQDLTDNIVHLVLARLPDSPPGVKGISLFIVPKFLPADGARNALACGALEDKMGLHGNSTCTMNFDGATGWLLGEADKGLAGMFVMMNHARLAVGVTAIGLMDAALQKALAYAREREQGRAPAAGGSGSERRAADPIIRHADVSRMLMTQKVYVEGCRAIALWATQLNDLQHTEPDVAARAEAAQLLALLTPVVKAAASDLAVQSILLAMQCFGGHGYIRANGVEQHLRDARIIPLYEGTNGVQAMDLLGRKVLADGGRRLGLFVAKVQAFVADHAGQAATREFTQPLAALATLVQQVTDELVALGGANPDDAGAAATPYLWLVSHLALAWMWARMAVVAQARLASGDPLYADKIATARFYFARLLPQAAAHAAEVRAGAASVMATPFA